MTREEIEKKVIAIAAERGGVPMESVTADSHFINDLHYDSLEAVEFTMEVEDEFGISVPDEQVEKFTTVLAVVDYVMEHSEAGAAKG